MKNYRVLATKETACFLINNGVRFHSDGEYLYFNDNWFIEEMKQDESTKRFVIAEIEDEEMDTTDKILKSVSNDLSKIRQIEYSLNQLLDANDFGSNFEIKIDVVKK